MMLVIYNWEYQIAKHYELIEDATTIKINTFEPVLSKSSTKLIPIVEALPFIKMLLANFFYSMKLRYMIRHHEKIIIFGLQDHLSRRVAELAVRSGKIVQIVPDNIEFFLRPARYCLDRKIELRKILRLLGLGYRLSDINKKVSIFSNRYIYQIPTGCELSEKYSFFDQNTVKIPPYDASIMFISQPYYLDYKLNIDEFVDCVGLELKKVSVMLNKDIYINFHQRDSFDYVKKISALEYKEFQDESVCGDIVGLFSTLLFIKALQGHSVFSFFSGFEEFFPNEYIFFVRDVAKELGICLEGKDSWVIEASDLSRLALDAVNG